MDEQQRKNKVKGRKQTTQVSVTILEMEWISEYFDLVDFYKFLSAQTPDKFSNDLIVTVLQQEEYKLGMYFVFGTYLLFMVLSVWYFSVYLFRNSDGEQEGSWAALSSSLILLTSIFLAYFELGTIINGR